MQALYRQQTQTLKPTAINIQPVSTVVSTHTSSKSVKFETIGHWERTMSSTGTMQKCRQRGTATDQMYKRGTLHQEDTDMHESGPRILLTQPHMGPGDFQVT